MISHHSLPLRGVRTTSPFPGSSGQELLARSAAGFLRAMSGESRGVCAQVDSSPARKSAACAAVLAELAERRDAVEMLRWCDDDALLQQWRGSTPTWIVTRTKCITSTPLLARRVGRLPEGARKELLLKLSFTAHAAALLLLDGHR